MCPGAPPPPTPSPQGRSTDFPVRVCPELENSGYARLPSPNVVATFRCRRLLSPNLMIRFCSRSLLRPNLTIRFCFRRLLRLILPVSWSPRRPSPPSNKARDDCASKVAILLRKMSPRRSQRPTRPTFHHIFRPPHAQFLSRSERTTLLRRIGCIGPSSNGFTDDSPKLGIVTPEIYPPMPLQTHLFVAHPRLRTVKRHS
jgi:hypothetical protein